MSRPRSSTAALVVAAIAGAMFGTGLLLTGLTIPARIIGFLDVAHWDPTLLFVLATAMVVYAIGFRWVNRNHETPWFGGRFHRPVRADLDARLIFGAAVFGVGWALGGLCPGPAIVSAGSGSLAAIGFVAAMVVGMRLAK